MSVDLHGCFLRVVNSRTRRYEGITGILYRESSHYIRIVTPQDQMIVIARQHAMVEWQVGGVIVSMRLAK